MDEKTIEINGVKYKESDLSEDQKIMINEVIKLDNHINAVREAMQNLRANELARESLFEKLLASFPAKEDKE